MGEHVVAGFTLVLRVVSGVLLLAMMGLTVVDVAGRYLFSAPVNGAFEATEIMLALVIFAGLPIVTVRRDHVTVEILFARLPTRLRRTLDVARGVLVVVLLAGAAWLLWDKGIDLSRWGDSTVLLRIPLGPVAYVLAALTALAVLAALIALVDVVRGRAPSMDPGGADRDGGARAPAGVD